MSVCSRKIFYRIHSLAKSVNRPTVYILQQRDASTAPYKCVVVGGGAGGCAMASKMVRKLGAGNVAVVEPMDVHYYQPIWTLVGSGQKTFAQSRKPMGQCLPKGAQWIKDSVSAFKPDENTVLTSNGLGLKYDMLICALGVKLDYDRINGAVDALNNDPAVCSNYSDKYVRKTLKAFQNFPKDGTAIFSMPPLPIKCPGAPQKIMYLFDDYLRQNGNRDGAKILYNTNLEVIFGVKKYAEQLLKVIESRDLTVNFKHNLVSVDHDTKTAQFAIVGSDPVETVTMKYDLLHISPPMVAPPALKDAGTPFVNAGGFLDVNQDTLQHTHYKNVFGIGDCTSCPTSKTAAAVAAESGVLARTVKDYLNDKDPSKTGRAAYDGYTSCPLITKQGKTILAEFNYQGQPQETFFLNQGKERTSMWWLKKEFMPFIYWNMLIRGYWHGPGVFRRLLNPFKS